MKKVYLAGQFSEYNNWKQTIKRVTGFDYYDPEHDSEQTSPETFYPQDLTAVHEADILIAYPGKIPAEATWIEIGYFLATHTNNPGETCGRLIIIWEKDREPTWSLPFVKKAGCVVRTLEEAAELLVKLK